MPAKKQLNPMLKLALDIGPLVLFFAANAKFGIFAATASFMVAVLLALGVSYVMTRHIAIMPVVTAVIVLVFGGLTIVLHDELFIKLKPTIIYLLFGGVLLGGLAFGKSFLGYVFDAVFKFRHAEKRPGQTGCQPFHCFQHIRNHDVHINGHTRVAVFLHRESADDEMGNVMFRQQRDDGAGRFH